MEKAGLKRVLAVVERVDKSIALSNYIILYLLHTINPK